MVEPGRVAVGRRGGGYYFEALGWSLYDSKPMPFAFGPWTVLECPEAV